MQPWVRKKNINFGREDYLRILHYHYHFLFSHREPTVSSSPSQYTSGSPSAIKETDQHIFENFGLSLGNNGRRWSRIRCLCHRGSWEVQCTKEHGVPGCEGGWEPPTVLFWTPYTGKIRKEVPSWDSNQVRKGKGAKQVKTWSTLPL